MQGASNTARHCRVTRCHPVVQLPRGARCRKRWPCGRQDVLIPEDLCRSPSPMQGVADRVQLNSELSCGNPLKLCSKTIAAGEFSSEKRLAFYLMLQDCLFLVFFHS